MDLNRDGHLDILSGCYSDKQQGMAGYFYVLWGAKDHKFQKAQRLKGTDGKPLEIQIENEQSDEVLQKICTRPFAADLNDDGHLDLLVGNFAGTFYLFSGTGSGKFSAEATRVKVGDSDLSVPFHSDPFLVDWDSDGDLDLLSGADKGGVYLSLNEGTKKEARFVKPVALVQGVRMPGPTEVRFGDGHMKGPQRSTRVWADDLNGDGKLDLLVGDSVRLTFPKEGLEEEKVRADYLELMAEQKKLFEDATVRANPELFEKHYQALEKRRKNLVTIDSTGFVWVLYQK